MKTTSTRGGTRFVGVRKAKAHLSSLLQDVQQGLEWIITERGKPIARLVPFPLEESVTERVRRLEQNGTIEAAPARRLRLMKPIEVEIGLARKILDADRDARA